MDDDIVFGCLKAQFELMKEHDKEIYERMLVIYANTTKWERDLTEDEARFLIDWSFKELDKKQRLVCRRDGVKLKLVERGMTKEVWCCPDCKMKVTLEDEE